MPKEEEEEEEGGRCTPSVHSRDGSKIPLPLC